MSLLSLAAAVAPCTLSRLTQFERPSAGRARPGKPLSKFSREKLSFGEEFSGRKISSRFPSAGAFRQVPVTLASIEGVPTTQKGWQYSEYGGVGVLTFSESIPVPALAPDQVLIRVAAAGINPVDFKRREGKFKATDSPLPTTPGYDVAGVVAAVGSAVTKFKKGDEVYSNISEAALNQPKQFGSLAQYTATEERLVAVKPRNLTFIQSAAVPLAVLTAQEAFDRAAFQPGQAVLILNGGGGVGSFAVQLAKQVYGAGFVAATGGPAKQELLKDLGADLAIDYTKEDFWERSENYDFVLDAIGDGAHAVLALKPSGRALLLTGPVPEGKKAERFVVTSRGSKLAELTPYFEKGAIKPILDPSGPYSFRSAADAFTHLESGHATGKVVVGPIE